MFDTLEALLAFHGPDSRAVVWAHNSHLGDAAATEMAARGEHNVGQLCRSASARGLPGRLRHRPRNGRRGLALGRSSSQDAMRPSHAQSYEACVTKPECRRSYCTSAIPSRGSPGRARGAATGTRHRRDLPSRKRAASHYFEAGLLSPVRRVNLVRSRPPHFIRSGAGAAGGKDCQRPYPFGV